MKALKAITYIVIGIIVLAHHRATGNMDGVIMLFAVPFLVRCFAATASGARQAMALCREDGADEECR